MTNPPLKPGPLLIRKYSNRRFYDTSRSCNVTLEDLHRLIGEGWDVKISDSKTEEDLTNAVLTQLILEHHAPKLAVFPATILHQIIRTQQQFLGGVMEQLLRQTLEAQRATHEQWARFVQSMLGVPAGGGGSGTAAADWMRPFLGVFNPPSPSPTPGNEAAEPPAGEVDELRRQVHELSQRLEALARGRSASEGATET